MTDKRISGLPLASPLTGNELVPIVQNGRTCQTPAASFGISNTVLLASGTITSPVSYIDLALPSGYAWFSLSLTGIEMSTANGGLSAGVSCDGGTTFVNDTTNFDSYAILADQLAAVAGTPGTDSTPFGGLAFDSLAYLQPGLGVSQVVDNGTVDSFCEIIPGSSTRPFRMTARSISQGTNDSLTPHSFFESAVITSAFSLTSVVTAPTGPANLFRILPYGPSGACNPPSGGKLITKGSYILCGVPVGLVANTSPSFEETSAVTVITSGTISSPVSHIDFALPTNCRRYRLTFEGIRFDVDEFLAGLFSCNSGVSFVGDTVNADSYINNGAGVAVTDTPGSVTSFNDASMDFSFTQLTTSKAGTWGTIDIDAGSVTDYPQTLFSSSNDSILGAAFSSGATVFNQAAIVPPPVGRANVFRLTPGAFNAGHSITAGSYSLWAISQVVDSTGDADSTPTNVFVNPATQVDQINEGSVASYTTSSGAVRVVDQWYFEIDDGDATATAQRVADAPAGISHSVKITITAANSTPGSTAWSAFQTNIEPNRFDGWQWGTANAQTVSLSFWMKCSIDAIFTAGISPLVANAPPNFLASFSVLAGVWTYCEVQIPGETTTTDWANGLFFAVLLAVSPVIPDPDRAWSNDTHFVVAGQTMLTDHVGATLQLTGFKLEPTMVPTPFYQASLAADLAECQRYYRKTFPQGTKPVQNAGINGALTTINPVASGYPNIMWEFGSMAPGHGQATPLVITTYNPSAANANWRDVTGAANVTVSVDPGGAAGTTSNASAVLLTTSAPVATAGHVLAIHAVADAWF